MLKKLIKLANHLDSKGFTKEADYLDAIIAKASDSGLKEYGAFFEVNSEAALKSFVSSENAIVKEIYRNLIEEAKSMTEVMGADKESPEFILRDRLDSDPIRISLGIYEAEKGQKLGIIEAEKFLVSGSEDSTSSGGRLILDFTKREVPEEELMKLYSHLKKIGLEETQDPSY
jgi:hypothetical protein